MVGLSFAASLMAVNRSIVDVVGVLVQRGWETMRLSWWDLKLSLWFQVAGADTLGNITATTYQNLTQESWVAAANNLVDPNSIAAGQYLEIPVNCSCDNPAVSPDHYLFLTYVVAGGSGGNLSGIASDFNTSTDLIKKFNPGVVWDNSQPTQYAFIPLPGSNSVKFTFLTVCWLRLEPWMILLKFSFVLGVNKLLSVGLILLIDQYGGGIQRFM